MSSQRSVSVIIATYNRAAFLPATVASIRAQTHPADEIIIIDDGSTDETPAVVAGLGGGISYERTPNRGPQAARALGVSRARGELVALIDDDDLWLPAKLALQVAALQRSGYSWVYGDAVAFDHASGADRYRFSEVCQPREGEVLEDLLQVNFIPSPTVLMRRALLQRINALPGRPNVRFGEDWLISLLAAAESPLARVPDVVARYRVHAGGAATRTGARQRLRDSEQVLDFCRAALQPHHRRGIERARGLARLKAAAALLAERRPFSALAVSGAAVGRRPQLAFEALGFALRLGARKASRKLRNLRASSA